jgi:hypothetical protein
MNTTVNLRNLYGAILLGGVAALSPLARAEVVVTESAGTVTELAPDALVIHSEVATAPSRYVVSKDITYVDEAGVPVAASVVRSGVPVTVQYVREADRVVARRVVVHAQVPGARVIERREVVPAPAVVEERRVVKPAPAVVEERRVVKPVAPAVIEERSTTTTTTTTNKRD